MALLRSVVFAIIFYLGTIVAVLSAFPVALAGPHALRAHAVNWARFHGWCCRVLLGIHTRVEGVIPQGTVIVASKHQSMYETIELLRLLDQPAVVLKQELADIPGWGKVARNYGVIPVDREGSASALRTMLRAARAAIAEGRGVLIFPEGTRVTPGEQPPLRAGFAGLYKALNLPVVAVALDSGRLCPRGRFVKRAGTIIFRFSDTLPPRLPREEIEAAVHQRINVLDSLNPADCAG
ncbi:1-acyl-sn-glycerol-3-phosphate acyltransferase [Sphingomonas laterariae]|uniref:1-acyl-sn-glycerol-3-phosphate acyltransferase n=1 Tax=Edaphosphingomonas laterariae TaxID=861865 RepID=A0A239CF95_9SPHN|nr:lysophospholipid acyltransferase family protein [Sphingomonas laterariae]SNS18338.1 1-acyl-sn-glycerol-3-phosphate acyltransferase [Sphingomonas laterariae]